MQAPHEVTAGSAPMGASDAPDGMLDGSMRVGPLTRIVCDSAGEDGALLSCPLPLPAYAGETTRAAASVARRSAYRMASFPVLAGWPPRRQRHGSVVNSDNQVALPAMPARHCYKSKKCQELARIRRRCRRTA